MTVSSPERSAPLALGLTNEWLFEGNAKLLPHQSRLIASGCDVVAVQRALGHATSTTTLTTYAHLWPSAESRVRDASCSSRGGGPQRW